LKIKTLLYGISTLLIASVALLWQGCYKFSGNQEVPAYLQINSISIQTSYYDQGTNSSNITDAWVYVDDALLGVFELPAHFPVLAEGKHKLEIRPGIKLNGISSTRVPYPFYKPIIYESRNFIPEITDSLKNISTTYYSNTTFQWMEDFEGSNISFYEPSASDTAIKQTSPKNSPDAFLSSYSHYSGRISLTEDKPEYVGYSFNSFPMPESQGASVLLELNFKTNNFVTVGLLMQTSGIFKEVPLVILGHTDEWKKIYINLGPNISLNSTADDYKVLFRAGFESDSADVQILLDNIKIVSRQ
jgi:hypothetical protein